MMYVCLYVCLYVCMLHMYTYIWIDYICKYIYTYIYMYYCSLLFGHRSAISSLEILPPNISNADSGWSKGTSVEKLCREHVSHLEIWNNWWDGSGLMSLHTFLVLSSLLTSLWLPYVVITVVAINPVRKTMVIFKNHVIIIVNPSGPYLRLKQARFPSLPSSYSCFNCTCDSDSNMGIWKYTTGPNIVRSKSSTLASLTGTPALAPRQKT